jgi:hypothetical protein
LLLVLNELIRRRGMSLTLQIQIGSMSKQWAVSVAALEGIARLLADEAKGAELAACANVFETGAPSVVNRDQLLKAVEEMLKASTQGLSDAIAVSPTKRGFNGQRPERNSFGWGCVHDLVRRRLLDIDTCTG